MGSESKRQNQGIDVAGPVSMQWEPPAPARPSSGQTGERRVRAVPSQARSWRWSPGRTLPAKSLGLPPLSPAGEAEEIRPETQVFGG